MTRPGIEPWPLGPLANTLLIRPMVNCTKLIVSKVSDRSRGRPEGSFLIATTPRCRGGYYTYPWIAPLYPRYVPYIAEC